MRFAILINESLFENNESHKHAAPAQRFALPDVGSRSGPPDTSSRLPVLISESFCRPARNVCSTARSNSLSQYQMSRSLSLLPQFMRSSKTAVRETAKTKHPSLQSHHIFVLPGDICQGLSRRCRASTNPSLGRMMAEACLPTVCVSHCAVRHCLGRSSRPCSYFRRDPEDRPCFARFRAASACSRPDFNPCSPACTSGKAIVESRLRQSMPEMSKDETCEVV